MLLPAGAIGLLLVSGGSSADPRTPAALPGMPPPFLGTALVGNGRLTAAIDAYGDVVDMRAPGPAGRGLIDNPSDRQAARTVAVGTGIVPRVKIEDGPALPMWRADSVSQRYLPGTNVVRTVARFGRVRISITDAAVGGAFARRVQSSAPAGVRVEPVAEVNVQAGARCERNQRVRETDLLCSSGEADSPIDSSGDSVDQSSVGAQTDMTLRSAAVSDREWLDNARPLGRAAPRWAREMYRRSLLTLRALTDRRTGAVAAGARDGWAYVWPRDAATAALAFAAAGYRSEAEHIARFLLGVDLDAGARYQGDGNPVAVRAAQGDAAGWVAVASDTVGLTWSRRQASRALHHVDRFPWRGRADYQEADPGDYLANAIASTSVDEPKTPLYEGKWAHLHASSAIAAEFGAARGLVRTARDPGSGLDTAAAWAVRPFPLPALYPEVRRTMLRLAGQQTRFGITPGEGWTGGVDPWTAPTAWTAWSLAALADRDRLGRPAVALGERRQALRLLGDLRRAATPAGALPERVDARTGAPRSTTPLAWSHAFAILALRQLWPQQ